ncbi:carboxypeptidase-like regulatory domain-containing protein [Rubinisphaera margarita]|uniref:carboxypeptidase-like regulatory domain-containing protein n=1 Tax=Rubinisphaera margarita TaxID=2909586 RepID=UPI001EE99D37|nr:carboxypeptidase-like regulatory domain-containing protein [Rubinisphaera margarita]MCG6157995.1 carboxypeptidase-like regulatory domain-containing protein [Rubinisphaera margarita]
MFRPAALLMFLALTSPALLVGCGGGGSSDQPELGKVSGTVTMDGQPLSNVTVTFVPQSGAPSFGVTDESGKYELTYSGSEKGAAIGEHKVSITTPTEGPPEPGYKDPVPTKYNENTTLTATVVAGDNPSIDFALDSK